MIKKICKWFTKKSVAHIPINYEVFIEVNVCRGTSDNVITRAVIHPYQFLKYNFPTGGIVLDSKRVLVGFDFCPDVVDRLRGGDELKC